MRRGDEPQWFASPWPWCVAALLGVAAYVRFETLAQRPLWLDERFTLAVVKAAASLGDVWRVGEHDHGRHPPLHYVLSYWTHGLAGPRVALRAPSAVFGVLYVGVLASLGRRLFDVRVGLLAGSMAALSTYHVNYSQDGRSYSLVAFLVVSQVWFFYEVLRHRRPRDLVGFVACGTTILYSHHIGFAVQAFLGIVALGLVAARSWARRGGRLLPNDTDEVGRAPLGPASLLLALLVIGASYLPNLPELIGFLTAPEQAAARHTLALSWRLVHDVAARWGSGDGPAAFLFLACLTGGLVHVLKRRDARVGIIVWLATPFVLYSIVPFSKFFSIRYAIPAMPAFTLLSAAGAVALADAIGERMQRYRPSWQERRVANAVVGLVAAVLLVSQVAAYSAFRTTTERCSSFHEDPFVLRLNDSFCERFIVLNSLNPRQSYLLHEVAAPAD